jgi:hypothetical protein
MKRCWEFKNCGKEDCVEYKKQKGSVYLALCWIRAGTMSGGKISGDNALRIEDCRRCDYFLYLSNQTKKHKVA